jgi:hypothetical protein
VARDILVGRTLGPYLIEQRLGGGGIATVYRGLHQALGLRRAVKVMAPGLATNDSFVELFYREARLAASLRHPNIVEIFDVAQQDGLHYLVMQLLAGRSLRDVVRGDSPIALARGVHLVAQLAEALDYAHHQGIVHRDVKSANAFVGPADRLTLVDFGIARAADATHLTVTHGIGTPEYMAPEMFDERLAPSGADDHAIGVGSDLYGLGVVAYEVVTGALPFVGRTPQAIAYAQVNRAPPSPATLRPELPAAVEAVILRQLAKAPGERYRSARAFAAALTESLREAALLDVAWPTRLLVELEPAGRPEAEATMAARADQTVARGQVSPWRWQALAVAVLLLLALGASVGLPFTSPPGPTIDPTGIADAQAARGAAEIDAPTATAATVVPSTGPPAPTTVPTGIPTRVAVEPVPTPTPGPERQADEIIAEARAVIESQNDLAANLVLERLDRLRRELDSVSARRPAVEDLMIRLLLDDSERRLDAAFVLKDVEEGRASQKLLSVADLRFDRAARLRPGDAALQDRARLGRERVTLTALWVEFDAAYKAGQNDAQIAALTQIVAKRPEYRMAEGAATEKLYAAWISKAQEVWESGSVEQARRALDEAAKIDPTHPRARELRAAWFPPPRPALVRAAPPRAAPARSAPVQSAAVEAAPLPAASEPQAPPPPAQRPYVEVYVQPVERGSVDHNQPANSN